MSDHINLQHRCQRGESSLAGANNLLAECYATLGRLTAERDALQQRLTAADERNDEAIDLLRRARAVIEGGGWADLERDIAKFFKPAEGGGDEAI